MLNWIVTTLMLLLVSCSTGLSQTSLIVLNDNVVYRVNTVGIEQLGAGTSVNCSRWQDNPLYVNKYDNYLLLSQTHVCVITRNGTVLQALPLPPECAPSHLVNASRAIAYVICKPLALDSWKPKIQSVVLDAGHSGYALEALQYGDDAGVVWLPSERNSAVAEDGRGGQCFAYIADNNICVVDMTSLMSSFIEVSQCTALGSLEPANGKCRFALDCFHDEVRKRYVMDQTGIVDVIPSPLVCDSPLIPDPRGRYVLAFCSPFTYIMNLTSGTKNYVVVNGITMGDQLVFLPNEQVAIVTRNKDITILNLDLEYRVPGSGRRTIPNTASVARRPISVTRDGMLVTCSTDGTSNRCGLFDVSSASANEKPITTFDLASIRPDAVIVEQGVLTMTTSADRMPTSLSSPTTAAQKGSTSPSAIPVALGVVGVVVVALVALVVVLVVIYKYHYIGKKAQVKVPLEESPQQDATRPYTLGGGEGGNSSIADIGDGSSIDYNPTLPSNQSRSPSPSPHHSSMVTGLVSTQL